MHLIRNSEFYGIYFKVFFRINILQEYFYLRFTNFIGVIKFFKFSFSLNVLVFQ